MLYACRDCQNFSSEEICEDDNEATYEEEDDKNETDNDKSDEASDEGIEEEQNLRIDGDDVNVLDLFNEQSDKEWWNSKFRIIWRRKETFFKFQNNVDEAADRHIN